MSVGRNVVRSVAAVAVVVLVAGGVVVVAGSRSSSPGPAGVGGTVVDKDQVRGGLLKAPLAFVANTGALDERVAFWLPGSTAAVYLTDAGLTYRLSPSRPAAVEGPGLTGLGAEPAPVSPPWVVAQEFVGAAPVRPVAAEASPTTVSFFKGAPEQWRSGVSTAASVRYEGLWPGVDATYAGTGERLKYEFTVAPGADPAAVRLAYRGAERVTLTPGGELRIETPAGGFTDAAPTAYRDAGGRRVPVEVSYAMGAPEADGAQPYGFALGPHDPTLPLVIDPATIVYAGFLGGNSDDEGHGIAVDGAGAAYVTGAILSTEASFPVAVGPDLTANGNFDAFVAKVAPGGATLAYAGFLGGNGTDAGRGIAVDGAGAAYLTGIADSRFGAGFPVAVGPDLTANGDFDAFVAKVDPGGATLAYAGFLGGNGEDRGLGIAVDGAGAAYVTGFTLSTEATFPVAVGPDLTANGGRDAFVAKVAPGGATLAYAGFLGGTGFDEGRGIAVDGTGAAYLTGITNSTEASFPVTVGPDLTANGFADAFVAKVATNASLPAVVRASTTWIRGDRLANGAGTFTTTYGTKPLTPMYGDWDGNGSETPATYQSGTLTLRNDHLGGTPTTTIATGFDPRGFAVAGDFNGDGTDDVAVFRNGLWQVRLSTGVTFSFSFGSGTWPATVPVAGDWDGDGTDGIGTYDYATGTWNLRDTATAGGADAGTLLFWAGPGTASYPVVGDWDANGTDTVGIKAATTWTLRNTNTPGAPDITFTFGMANDLPLSWR